MFICICIYICIYIYVCILCFVSRRNLPRRATSELEYQTPYSNDLTSMTSINTSPYEVGGRGIGVLTLG